MRSVVIFICLGLSLGSYAQCPRIIDGNGVASTNPRWVHCAGTGYTLFIQTNINVGAYTIDWGDGNTTNGASLIPPATVSHTYPATLKNYNITFTEPGKGCVINGLLVIERPVNASITRPLGSGGATTICAPGSLGFINTSTDGSANTTYRWNFGDGSAIVVKGPNDTGLTTTHTYLQNTVNCNTVVTLEAENYCTTTPSFAQVGPINVYDIDDAGITPTATFLCYPDTVVGFLNTSNLNCRPQGNTVQRYEHWNFGNHWGKGQDSILGWIPFANPPSQTYNLKFPGKGTYTITLQDSNMCGVDQIATTITIGDPPVAAFTPNKDTVCAGKNITFVNNSSGGANQSRWNFGDGVWRTRNMNNQTRTFNTPGPYTIYLAVLNTNGSVSCTDTITKNIYVLAGPTADFSINPASGCDSTVVAITENASNAALYNWNFGDGTSSSLTNPPAHKYDSVAVYTLALTVTHANGCTDATSKTVTIYGSPVVDFTPKNVCEGVVASFTDNSTSPVGDPITTWNWSFGDGGSSNAQNPTHQYDTSKTYSLSLTVSTAHCTSNKSFNLVVEPKPTADFSILDTAGCSPLGISFTNTSLVSSVYLWNFGDGDTSSLTSPSHSFLNSSLSNVFYNISLIASTAFGCSDTAYDTVEVYQVPNASFTSTAVAACGPYDVDFTNTSTGGISRLWLFGDGDTSTANNPTHTYQNKTNFNTIYKAKLVVYSANGCTDTTQQSITIYPEPIFPFQTLPDSGCSPLRVTFPALVGAVAYKWYFGDGDSATGPSPSHTFTNSTTNNFSYTTTLIATNSSGCSDTNSANILVFPNPRASFTTLDSVSCQPHPVTFTNNSTGAVAYKWNFGNGVTSDTTSSTISQTYIHNLSVTKHSTIQLIAITADGCRDTAYHQVSTFPKIIAGFSPNRREGCSPLPVVFQDTSRGAQFYSWTFGDGSSSAASAPSHTFSNSNLLDTSLVTQLKITSQFGCTDSVTDTMLVHPLPIANFSKTVINGCHPLLVGFTNNSQIADTNFWYFGDGNTNFTNSSSIQHTYVNAGSISVFNTVKLITETNFGCKDSSSQIVEVYPEIIARAVLSDTVGCTDLPVSFSSNSKGAQFFKWKFGDGDSSITASSSHTFKNTLLKDTTFTVKFKVSSTYGCEDSTSQLVRIHPKPVAAYSHPFLRGCHPFSVNLTNTSSIADTNFWFFGDGNTSFTNATSVNHIYLNTGAVSTTHNLKLIAQTVHGCKDSVTRVVTVYPEIIARCKLSDTIGCTDLNVVFKDTSKGAQFFDWRFGDGNSATTPNTQHTYSNTLLRDTVFKLSYLVVSGYGCADSLKQDITVHAKPISSFLNSVNKGCQDLAVDFTNNSQIADINLWNFGDGDTSMSGGNVRHTYTHTSPVSQKYRVTHKAITLNGCQDSTSKEIEVYPQIHAGFAVSDSNGCSELTVQMFNQSIGENQYDWDFGDGNSERIADPVHRFSNTDTVNLSRVVKLKVTSVYGCKDSASRQMTIYPQPVANLLASPGRQKFPSATVTLGNNSSIGPWSHNWSYGDGNTSSIKFPGSHTYDTWGEFSIELIVKSPHCSDTALQKIIIEPPRAVVAFTGSGRGCRPLTVNYTNQTQYGKNFIWNFGDGGTSSLEAPAPYTYYNPGTFSVTLTVIGFDGEPVTVVKEDSVVVNEESRSFFDLRPDVVSVPSEPVLLYNLSNFADRWIWDMGDGTTYTERNPEHYYKQGGVYTITLISDNEFGCADTFSIENAVTANAEGSVTFPNAFIPDATSRGSGQYDPNSLDNAIFFPIIKGVVEYELIIFNRWGEMVFRTEEIHTGWTGYYRDTEKLCAQDVYVWKATGKFVNGDSFEEAGEVTLLR
ncbi:MAG: PKD domain-containing protein [Flavobacteriales bacterium]|nr:PKD domain-containing protein [Flavobacteriales bacterium]